MNIQGLPPSPWDLDRPVATEPPTDILCYWNDGFKADGSEGQKGARGDDGRPGEDGQPGPEVCTCATGGENGAAGSEGQPGTDGGNGVAPNMLVISIKTLDTGDPLRIFAEGSDGGAGGVGGHGGPGGNGGNAGVSPEECVKNDDCSGHALGGNGGNGGNGGRGGKGGRGGDGGDVMIAFGEHRGSIFVHNSGGAGGRGGAPGMIGSGGQGGANERPDETGEHRTGHDGLPGAPGVTGSQGVSGNPGLRHYQQLEQG